MTTPAKHSQQAISEDLSQTSRSARQARCTPSLGHLGMPLEVAVEDKEFNLPECEQEMSCRGKKTAAYPIIELREKGFEKRQVEWDHKENGNKEEGEEDESLKADDTPKMPLGNFPATTKRRKPAALSHHRSNI